VVVQCQSIHSRRDRRGGRDGDEHQHAARMRDRDRHTLPFAHGDKFTEEWRKNTPSVLLPNILGERQTGTMMSKTHPITVPKNEADFRMDMRASHF
jgi:hypothetical protein